VHLVIAVDWSDEAFTAVREAVKLYAPREVTLVHAVDLGVIKYPAVAQAAGIPDAEHYRTSMLESGRNLLEQTAAMITPGVRTVNRVCEIGSPAAVILDALAAAAVPNLVVLGSRLRGEVAEMLLGSVSHRVLLHATCPTLIVKRPIPSFHRVLLAIEGLDDAVRLPAWLQAHPFALPVELTVMTVVPKPSTANRAAIPPLQQWRDTTRRSAEELLQKVTEGLRGAVYPTVSYHLSEGDPPDVIAREAALFHLLVVGSHAKSGLERFLLGSVSHAVSHRAICPVLVIR
jgi:nucleotide-binding universal stress UspA family protein